MVCNLICHAISWLHEWQELVGAIIGATALAFTVWWTLSSERRKRNDEATALRIALGIELRQYATGILFRHHLVLNLLPSPIRKNGYTDRMASELTEIVRLPDPIIFSHSAGSIGVLGESAQFFVRFYNTLWSATDRARQLATPFYAPKGPNMLTVNGAIDVAGTLLNATEDAVRALPAFAGMVGSEDDEQLKQDVANARSKFDALKSSAET
jgi:hypothetical protein